MVQWVVYIVGADAVTFSSCQKCVELYPVPCHRIAVPVASGGL